MPEDAGPERDTPQTPDQSGPYEGTPAEGEIDFETRYNDLRPYADRVAQENAEYRDWISSLADPENLVGAAQTLGLTEQELLQAMGYQDADDEDEFDEDDVDEDDENAVVEALARRQEGVEQYLLAQAEAETETEAEEVQQDFLEEQLDALEQETGPLPDQIADAIGNLALSYRDEDGMPDIASAFVAFMQASELQQNAYLESKKAAALGQGIAGADHVNLNDADARVKAAADVIEAVAQADEG